MHSNATNITGFFLLHLDPPLKRRETRRRDKKSKNKSLKPKGFLHQLFETSVPLTATYSEYQWVVISTFLICIAMFINVTFQVHSFMVNVLNRLDFEIWSCFLQPLDKKSFKHYNRRTNYWSKRMIRIWWYKGLSK